MDLGLAGKHALVTGATAGIGLALAKGLAAEGASVVITGRTQATVAAALKRLRQAVPEGKIIGLAADAATAAGARAVFERVPETDVLINNLGIHGRKPAFEIDDEEWRRYFEVNVMSGIRFTRHYAPGMAKRGWGRVLFVSSESALNIPREMIHGDRGHLLPRPAPDLADPPLHHRRRSGGAGRLSVQRSRLRYFRCRHARRWRRRKPDHVDISSRRA